MKIEILGAGGASIVPRPFCTCTPCLEALEKGAPYTRYGPSIYIHDLHLLIDTPEEIAYQLTRSRIPRVDACLYSHWHPDHTAGFRLWEHNLDPEREWSLTPTHHCTDIYLPEIVAKTFQQWHDLEEKFSYLQKLRVVKLHTVREGESINLQGMKITPFVLAEDYVCGFLFEGSGKRFLICMDELYGWIPPDWLGKLDLAIIPAGMFDIHPLNGKRAIPAEHSVLTHEATFTQTFEIVRKLNTPKVIYIHLNESDRLTFDEYKEVARRVNSDSALGLPSVEFAYDTMIIDL